MNKKQFLGLSIVLLVLGGSMGYGLARHHLVSLTGEDTVSAGNHPAKPLYWFDPMVPNQHFDKPGKSPFMDMELVPKMAGEEKDSTSVYIDSRAIQNLGIRWSQVMRGALPYSLTAEAILQLDERHAAVVQMRADGLVQRVYARAVGDVIRAGDPLADFLIPEWGAAQNEFLVLLKTDDPFLQHSGRERLKSLGMPLEVIRTLEKTGQAHEIVTIRSPINGVIQSLGVQVGMSVNTGATVATINGLDPVWLEASVPEAEAMGIVVGQKMTATVPAYPGDLFSGQVNAVLPEANSESHTLRVRMELPNHDGRLKPGLFATVHLVTGKLTSVLWIPSESIIRTGTRNLVMVSLDGNRFQPTEVILGAESEGRSVVLRGLTEGQKIVSSGQFLIDSEASLKGVMVRMANQGDHHD